tara:strand:+ start:772 stop:1146 length:375 start_codon:yes stop_codon:yes gene_type:complete
MGTVLLIFCITSVIITSVIVILELKGEKSLNVEYYNGDIKTTNFYGQRILLKDKKTNEELRNRVFETLDQQLDKLGFISKGPKLDFINTTLKSDYKDLDELSPTELEAAFVAILKEQESKEIAA